MDDVRSRLRLYHVSLLVPVGKPRVRECSYAIFELRPVVRTSGHVGRRAGRCAGPRLGAPVGQLFVRLLWAYGRLYILSLPPELVALHVLRKLRAGGSGATERWGFRVLLVGMWLMVIGVFADYSGVDVRHLGFGFFAQMAATPILLVGFAVLGIGLRKEAAVPRWVTLVKSAQ